MTKLSLNKAAKEAGVAKSTILEALNSNDPARKLSAEKNAKGHWEIDPAELFRVFPKTSSDQSSEPIATPVENHQKPLSTSGLEIEVKMLREQIDRMDTEREREREQLVDQIESLRGQMERQSADHRAAIAVLTDQRAQQPEKPRKGFWARLAG